MWQYLDILQMSKYNKTIVLAGRFKALTNKLGQEMPDRELGRKNALRFLERSKKTMETLKGLPVLNLIRKIRFFLNTISPDFTATGFPIEIGLQPSEFGIHIELRSCVTELKREIAEIEQTLLGKIDPSIDHPAKVIKEIKNGLMFFIIPLLDICKEMQKSESELTGFDIWEENQGSHLESYIDDLISKINAIIPNHMKDERLSASYISERLKKKDPDPSKPEITHDLFEWKGSGNKGGLN